MKNRPWSVAGGVEKEESLAYVPKTLPGDDVIAAEVFAPSTLDETETDGCLIPFAR